MKQQENDHQPPRQQQQQQQQPEPKPKQLKEQLQEQEEEDQETEPESPPHTTMHYPVSPPLEPIQPPPHKPSSPPQLSESPPESIPSSDRTSHSYVFPPPAQVKLSTTLPPSPPTQTAQVKVSTTPSSSPPNQTAQVKAQDGDVPRQEDEEAAGGGAFGGTTGRKLRPNLSILRKSKRENMKRKALLSFRVLAFVFCLVSFSLMAADKNQGWALDSFYRYKEFRYCMTVNVLGFVYSGLQAYDLAHFLTSKRHVLRNHLRYYLDFALDQILAYLLLSASSSANFRVEDWEDNWGKDKFPKMARASVALSFLAFIAFALSSLLSGHTLFTPISS